MTELNANLLPAQGNFMWRSCAAALDGCIYFMPSYANRMKKLDASNNDEIATAVRVTPSALEHSQPVHQNDL